MSSIILAIDPGLTHSAYILYHQGLSLVLGFGKIPNDGMLKLLAQQLDVWDCACERIRSYGKVVGSDIFETCEWTGAFRREWVVRGPGYNWHWVDRMKVKLNLCGFAHAKDINVRAAVIDRFGGAERAIGRKSSPGPLYGISGDVWAALAVALTFADVQKYEKGAA